ncbi:hypothetical protein O181_092952 [Austropuccinia psidii MF-1]|uniref:Uncharacterized protein n=1 Tax=Austropuccinia psidii MF-1 TaxID=1389203 RepID=A0A9Q3PA31_9BASI|nr:hypothetical protein [Austropuccinia psidii MF-1]
MLIGIREGHHNHRLFDPKTNSIYISNDCIFKDKEAFWPSHSSSALVTSKDPLLLPSMPAFDFSFQNYQNPADESENDLSVPGEGLANPEIIPIWDTTSPSYNLEPPT